MGRTLYYCGEVIDGDYKGKKIFFLFFANEGLAIVDNDENGKIIYNSMFPTKYTIIKKINKSTVSSYKELTVDSGDVALYFNDGRKSLVNIFNNSVYQDFKRQMFVL